jgi:hypothetical protein
MLNSLFKFFASLKLAVISILSLAAVLATATILESMYGMRSAHVLVYGTWWFTGLLFLLGTNVLCAAMIRYPWKRHQTGFVITHCGILIILFGSLMTQKLGVDGNLPIVEQTEDNEVVMNDLVLGFYDQNNNLIKEYPVRESATQKDGIILELDFPNSEKIVVDRFIPRAVAERNVENSPLPGVGAPAVEVELANQRFRMKEWLAGNRPGTPTEMNLGPAVLTIQKLWSSEEEKSFLSKTAGEGPARAKNKTNSLGTLLVSYRGLEVRLPVAEALKHWKSLANSELEVSVDEYLPFAIVQNNHLVSKSNVPANPALQISLRDSTGKLEKHTVFANFPEFKTLHGATGGNNLGVKFRFLANAPGPEGKSENESLPFVGKKRGRLSFAVSPDDKKLYYRVIAASGGVNGVGEVEVGKEQSTGWMDIRFKVNKWFPAAVQEERPHYVEYISGTDGNFLTGLRLTHYANNAGEKPETAWLLENRARTMNVGGTPVTVAFGKNRLMLPFKIFLQKFTMGTDPGTSKAATYESDVTVRDRVNGVDKVAKISMNEPLKYGGYYFYQASYQMEEGRPPVSVFSVNYDPGRWLKYLGAIVMVLGILTMFYMNPHYWDKILGKKKVST